MWLQQILLDVQFKDLLNPEFYILHGGLFLILFIVFAETGLFAGFFLPGDSLLFVTGIYSQNFFSLITTQDGKTISPTLSFLNTGNEFLNLLILGMFIVAAGFVGNEVGYFFGRRIGPAMFSWKDRFLFKKKYLFQAKELYDAKGGMAIIVARFIPIARTFAPIVAGIVGMDKKKFLYYNLIGCIAWVYSMIFAGHYLYTLILKLFNFDLKKHLEVIVLGIVFVTTAPVIYKMIFGKVKSVE